MRTSTWARVSLRRSPRATPLVTGVEDEEQGDVLAVGQQTDEALHLIDSGQPRIHVDRLMRRASRGAVQLSGAQFS